MHLLVEEGPLQGKVFLLENRSEWIIGRDQNVAQIVIEDTSVLRKHARLIKKADGFCIVDISHKKPVLVNEKPAVEEQLLHEGDRIKIGDSIFIYSEEELPHITEEVPHKEEEIQENPEEEVGAETIFLEEPKEEIIDTLFESQKNGEEKKEKVTPEKEEVFDTIYEDLEKKPLLSSSRFILKVVSGPNQGGEFLLEKGKSYIIGKNFNLCDITFNDISVSKKHAKITLTDDDKIYIEDLKSKNKTYVNQIAIEEKTELFPQDVISLGSSTFTIIDKEKEEVTSFYEIPTKEKLLEEKKKEAFQWKKQIIPFKHLIGFGAFVVVSIIAIISFFTLFKVETVPTVTKDVTKELNTLFKKYEGIQFSYNPQSESLFLNGHVLNSIQKQELLYSIKQINYINAIEDNIIIDENVWKSINGILSDNKQWRGVSVHAVKPGQFIISGYLKNTQDSESLNDYLNMNFPYTDRLENKVVVEDILKAEIATMLKKKGLMNIAFGLTNGEVILTGQYSHNLKSEFHKFTEELEKKPGVRQITNLTIASSPDQARIDLSAQYKVTGYAKADSKNMGVVINGKIVTVGDLFEEMKITQIDQHTILLEKDDVKYKISYSPQNP
jgi:type III secretion system YscD/HrpQ family protein